MRKKGDIHTLLKYEKNAAIIYSHKTDMPNLCMSMCKLISIDTILSHFMVELLDGDVVTQQVKALAIRLPEKLEPRRQDGTIGAVLHVFTTHGTHQQAVGHTSERLQLLY